MFRFILLMLIANPIFAYHPIKEEKQFTGHFDLGLNYTQNINKTLQFNNVIKAKYKYRNSLFTINNNISFIEKTGEKQLLNKGNQDIKYSLNTNKINANLTLEHLYDISRSIKKRWTGGIGASYIMIKSEKENMDIGISTIREKEITTSEEVDVNTRLSTNLNFSIKFLENVELTSKNHYQPKLEDPGDFRWKTNVSIRLKIKNNLLLSINNTFNYDSFPETNVPETDYQLINSISYTF